MMGVWRVDWSFVEGIRGRLWDIRFITDNTRRGTYAQVAYISPWKKSSFRVAALGSQLVLEWIGSKK